ncbi:hypothetical protein [Dactylosporangium darangshiense]|uniref:Uncharacterized protein n=1 Tax=Dactylosporangium darangshiense TaxID=579108 RepID=A0ABP8DLQ5_9ACTN
MGVKADERVVSIPLEQAIKLARVLESVVISLDCIGSRQPGGDADARMLDQYVKDWLVAPQLSRARMIVWDAIGQVIGEEATEEIAEAVPRFPQPVPDEVRQLAEEPRRWNEEVQGLDD